MAVKAGRDIAPTINELLSLPFTLKIATRDFHPADHISFATSHEAPDNKAFESRAKIGNPDEFSQYFEIPLWPPHCVQGSRGAEIIPELNVAKLDQIVNKGRDKRLETFSGFADVFGRKTLEAIDADLAEVLRSRQITHVFVVGLAGDYCVKCTALDARKEGFEVYVVEEGVKSIEPGDLGWGAATRQMQERGIHIIKFASREIERVKQQV